MARGPKKHLKRINTPRSWLLSKTGGINATRPNQGPHKLRECLPLSIIIRYTPSHLDITSNSHSTLVMSAISSKTKMLESKLIIKSEETTNSLLVFRT